MSETGGSALSGLLHLIGGSDSGGIGVCLPLLLAFSLGAAVAVSEAARVASAQAAGLAFALRSEAPDQALLAVHRCAVLPLRQIRRESL